MSQVNPHPNGGSKLEKKIETNPCLNFLQRHKQSIITAAFIGVFAVGGGLYLHSNDGGNPYGLKSGGPRGPGTDISSTIKYTPKPLYTQGDKEEENDKFERKYTMVALTNRRSF